MRNLMSLVLICGLIPALSANSSGQLGNVAATFNAPFEFWVNGTRFAPGEYFLDSSVPSMAIVRSKDALKLEVVPTIVDGDPVAEKDARVIFVLRNGRYQLMKIRGVLGKRTLTAHLGEDNGDGLREVKIEYSRLTAETKTHGQ